MELEIQQFILYLEKVKRTSANTRLSYERDLHKLKCFLSKQAVEEVKAITLTNLNSYILYLEREKFAPSTISRNIAAIKSFYHYLIKEGKVTYDISEELKAPKVEKKAPEILALEDVIRLLEQPNLHTNKGIRDKAMLELLYATGIRVSELISLKVEDVNLFLGYIVCRDINKERTVPFGNKAGEALEQYMKTARTEMAGENSSDILFLNCSGGQMSRQGFWKVLKSYGKKAGIQTEITPHTLRHSLAIHLMSNGIDIQAVQEMLGHSDVSSTQVYVQMINNQIRNDYKKAHPRN